MYSASVLMVYEGDEEAMDAGLKIEAAAARGEGGEEDYGNEKDPDEEDEEDEDEDDEVPPQKVHDVRLIDFAHAGWTPGQGPDENALHGIRSLLAILKGLVD